MDAVNAGVLSPKYGPLISRIPDGPRDEQCAAFCTRIGLVYHINCTPVVPIGIPVIEIIEVDRYRVNHALFNPAITTKSGIWLGLIPFRQLPCRAVPNKGPKHAF